MCNMVDNKIYMINESLLDDVNVDEVEDVSENGEYVKVVFSISFIHDLREDGTVDDIRDLFDLLVKRNDIIQYEIDIKNNDVNITFSVEREFDIDDFNKVLLWTSAIVGKIHLFLLRVMEFGNYVAGRTGDEYCLAINYMNRRCGMIVLDLDAYSELFPGCDEKIVLKSIGSNACRFEMCKDICKSSTIYLLKINRDCKDEEGYFKYVLVRKDGKIIYESSFSPNKTIPDIVCSCGLIRVFEEGKGYNYIDFEGNYISEDFFKNGMMFSENDSVAIVTFHDDTFGMLDKSGDIIARYKNIDIFGNCGMHIVRRDDGKFNYIDNRGNVLIKDRWFDSVERFANEGYGMVKDEKGSGIIDTTGKILFQFPDFTNCSFADDEGNFIVYRTSSDTLFNYNYVNSDGELVLDEWCESCSPFKCGIGVIKTVKGETFVDTKGNYVCVEDGKPVWFEECSSFDDEGNAEVIKYINGEKRVNFIDTSGKCISDEWFDRVYGINYDGSSPFYDGFAAVYKKISNWKCGNFIGRDGKLLLEDWSYDIIARFNDGYAVIEKDDSAYCIDTSGKILCKKKITNINIFKDGLSKVENASGKCNYMKPDGKMISKEWFSDMGRFEGNICEVKRTINRKNDYVVNYIDRDGNLILDDWLNVSFARYTTCDGCMIIKNEKNLYNLITADGKLFDKTWRSKQISYDEDSCLFKIDYFDIYVDKHGDVVSLI